jgi:hypothetical protein
LDSRFVNGLKRLDLMFYVAQDYTLNGNCCGGDGATAADCREEA